MANVQTQATNQLSNLPFSSLIGGPLDAAVKAQAQAAMSSVNFIQSIAFDENDNVRTVEFTYQKGDQEMKLVVPILAIVPIPFIRIDDMSINFKANISADTSTKDTTTTSKSFSANLQAKASYLWASASLNASASSKKDSTSSRDSKYAVEYTMDVSVHASQDDMPAGMGKILNILNEAIEPSSKSGSGGGSAAPSGGGKGGKP